MEEVGPTDIWVLLFFILFDLHVGSHILFQFLVFNFAPFFFFRIKLPHKHHINTMLDEYLVK